MGDEATGINSIQSKFFPKAAEAFLSFRQALHKEAVPEVEEAFRELDTRDCVMLDPGADICLYRASDPRAAYCIWFKVGSGIGGRLIGRGLTEAGGGKYLQVKNRVAVEFGEDGLHLDAFEFVSVSPQIFAFYGAKWPMIIHETSLEKSAYELGQRAVQLKDEARDAVQPESGISRARKAAMWKAAVLARKEAAQAYAELERIHRLFSSRTSPFGCLDSGA